MKKARRSSRRPTNESRDSVKQTMVSASVVQRSIVVLSHEFVQKASRRVRVQSRRSIPLARECNKPIPNTSLVGPLLLTPKEMINLVPSASMMNQLGQFQTMIETLKESLVRA